MGVRQDSGHSSRECERMSEKTEFTCKLCDRTFGTKNRIWATYHLYEGTKDEVVFDVCYGCIKEMREIHAFS